MAARQYHVLLLFLLVSVLGSPINLTHPPLRASEPRVKGAGRSGKMAAYHVDMRMPHFRPSYLEQWLAELAESGYTHVVWEVTDGVEFETCPEAAAPDALTKAEFREVLREGRRLGLEPIPLLQTLGHADYVLEAPKYARLRDNPESPYQYKPLDPEVIAFLRRWIKEHLELFGEVKYFHLGADEATLPFTDERARAFVGTHSVSKLFVEHVHAVAEPLLERGITPIIWDDMLLAHQEAIDELSRRILLYDWEYYVYEGLGGVRVWDNGKGAVGSREDFSDSFLKKYRKYLYPRGESANVAPEPFYTADYLADKGFQIVTCGAAQTSGDNVFCPRHELHLRNTFGQFKKGRAAHLKGSFLVRWSHHMHPWELQLACIDIPGFLDLHPDGTLGDYREYFVKRRFGTEDRTFWDAAELLSAPCLFSATPTLGYGMSVDPVNPKHVEETIARLEAEGRLEAERQNCRDRRLDYRDALILFEAFEEKAAKGRDILEIWKLAARNLLNRAECSELLLAKRAGLLDDQLSKAKARQLLKELESLRAGTDALYQPMIRDERRSLMLYYVYDSVHRALSELANS